MDSSKYLLEMRKCVEEAKNIVKKAKNYKEYSDKLKKVSSGIEGVAASLNSANNSFIGGGYVSSGQGLYQVEISAAAKYASEISNNLSSLVTATYAEIENFRTEYNRTKNRYELASTSFYNCKIHNGFPAVFPAFSVD